MEKLEKRMSIEQLKGLDVFGMDRFYTVCGVRQIDICRTLNGKLVIVQFVKYDNERGMFNVDVSYTKEELARIRGTRN